VTAFGCSLLENPNQFVGDGGAVDAQGDVGPSDGPTETTPPPSGTILWARSAGTAFLYGVASGSAGVAVSGVLSGPGDLGGGIILPSGAEDAVLAQYTSSSGAYMFSSRFGGGSPSGSGQVYAYLDALDISSVPIVS